MNSYLVDGNLASFKDGAVIAILSICMVFVVLLIIIVLTDLIGKTAIKDESLKAETSSSTTTNNKLDLSNESARIACLVAAIDYRNETHKQIKVINVREVK